MVERLERSLFAFMRHAGSPDDGRAAVAANRLICDQPEKHSNIYSERLAAGSPIHGQPELRSSSGARPGDRAPWRESQAHGVGARRLRGKIKTARRLRDQTKTGGAGRDRTDDILLAKQVLSQLSYSPKKHGGPDKS